MSKKVLVVYAGGTIGCAGEPLKPMAAGLFESLLRPHAAADWPALSWQLDSFEVPLDSASMQPAHWVRLAQHIIDAYADYDAFVILHGTDTMAWSAAALSFLLLGLDKPVILTGAQRPLAQADSDAPANLRLAMHAAVLGVPEVCIAFGGQLLRGNRAIKIHAFSDGAFASPDYPALGVWQDGALLPDASAGLPPPPHWMALSDGLVRSLAHERLRQIEVGLGEASVIALNLFPGLSAGLLRTVLQHTRPVVRGLVLSAYGAGNAPDSTELLEALRAAHAAGVVTVVVTQTRGGGVDLGQYETGEGLRQAGAIGGGDMTAETALAKLVFLVAQQLPQKEIEQALARPMAGEMSAPA